MISSHYNTDLGILEVRYTGRLGYTELKNFHDRLTHDQDIPRELRILTDARDGEYEITEKDVALVLEDIHLQMKSFTYIKAAYIHTKPRETAISLITGEKNTVPNYFHKVFSTQEAALNWLIQNNV